MNKRELTEQVAASAELNEYQAARAIDAMFAAVKSSLKKGGTVTLRGFGTFFVGKRAARAGRNPRTEEPIRIAAAKVPKFRPSEELHDAVN